MYYVLDEFNNKVEAFDKEGVLAVLEQAIEDGTLENIVSDSAFVTKLKCCVGSDTHKIGFVTEEKYNELQASGLIEPNAYYFITDDNSVAVIDEALNDLNSAVETINGNIVDLSNKALVIKAISIPYNKIQEKLKKELVRKSIRMDTVVPLSKFEQVYMVTCPCVAYFDSASGLSQEMVSVYYFEGGEWTKLNNTAVDLFLNVYYLDSKEA